MEVAAPLSQGGEWWRDRRWHRAGGEAFQLSLTRRFDPAAGDHVWLLALIVKYRPTAVLRRLGGGSRWCRNPADIEEFRRFIFDLARRFQTTCGWCGRGIPPDTEVFGGGGEARPGIDLAAHAGRVLPVYLIGPDKTVLLAVAGLDSDARRDGHDFVYMTCSEDCARSMKAAFVFEECIIRTGPRTSRGKTLALSPGRLQTG